MTTFVIFLVMRALRYIFLVQLLFINAQLFAQTVGDVPKFEYRAVWMTTIENLDWPRTKIKKAADIQKQKDELTAFLDSLHALNVNCVMLQTRVRGDVLYPSKIEPFSKVLTGTEGAEPGYDPLAFAIEECHKRGMQLHAWIVSLPLGNVQHVREMGRLALKNKHPELCRVYKGSWYMEPGEPATAEYLCNLVSEIVSNYDVDGVHFDYLRYPDLPRAYPDGYLYRRYGNGRSLADWRRDNITDIMRKLYRCVKDIKPWVCVSCAPLGKHDDLTSYSSRGYNARVAVYQDVQRWLREGIVDVIFPMIYFEGNNFYPFVLDWQEKSCGRHVVPGIGNYRLLSEYGGWNVDEIARQLVTSRAAGTAGSIMFRMEHLLGNIKGFTDIYSRIYSSPALVPPISWCAGEPPTAPASFVGERKGDTLTLTWSAVEASSGMPAIRYNLYMTTDTILDVSKGENLVALVMSDTVFKWCGSSLKSVRWAVTSVDAYGMESKPVYWTEKGSERMLVREEFLLPEPTSWGMQVVLRDAEGARLYRGAYRRRVGVRGLPPGMYLLEVVTRHGVVVERYPFSK